MCLITNSALSTLVLWLSFILTVVATEETFEYLPSTSHIRQPTLLAEDFLHIVKILPKDREVMLRIKNRQHMRLVFTLSSGGPLSLSLSSCLGIFKWRLFLRRFEEIEIVQNIPKYENKVSFFNHTRTKKESLFKKHKLMNVEIILNNFTKPDVVNPTVNYLIDHNVPVVEVELNRGLNTETWLYQKESAHPGLYVIKVECLCGECIFHASASKSFASDAKRKRELQSFKIKENKKRELSIVWGTRSNIENSLVCLAISQRKLYSSLCEAKREKQKHSKFVSILSRRKSFILGCTTNPYYSFPATPHANYFVSMWHKGSLIPFIQAKIKIKNRQKAYRMKAGVMKHFTLTSGGQINAKFRVRKSGKKLHVAAVSCFGCVKVVITAGKKRVAAAKGREALHLAVRHAPKAKLTIRVSPFPPVQAIYRVHLVVAHSARKLRIPRLPKNVQIKTTSINCTTGQVSWSKGRGASSYCIAMRRHPSGQPPHIRPPLQCGWEEVIRRPDNFDYLECFEGNSKRNQSKLITGLLLGESFLVNVLVRHPVTGKTLTLQPAMLNLPQCLTNANQSVSNDFGFNKYKKKFIF